MLARCSHDYCLSFSPPATHTINKTMYSRPYFIAMIDKVIQRFYTIEHDSVHKLSEYIKPRCDSGYSSQDELDFHTISGQAVPPKVIEISFKCSCILHKYPRLLPSTRNL